MEELKVPDDKNDGHQKRQKKISESWHEHSHDVSNDFNVISILSKIMGPDFSQLNQENEINEFLTEFN